MASKNLQDPSIPDLTTAKGNNVFHTVDPDDITDSPDGSSLRANWDQMANYSNSSRGLIKIVDKAGTFFTDLATAHAYVQSYTVSVISNESFSNGIYLFTVPNGAIFKQAHQFLQSSAAYIIDELGLISAYGDDAFLNNNGNSVFKNCSFDTFAFNSSSGNNTFGNCSFDDDSFASASGNNTFGTITVGNNFLNAASGVNTIENISLTSSGNIFAGYSTGRFYLNGAIGASTAQNYANFFLSSTASIFAKRENLTNNAGGMEGDLAIAKVNGATVFFGEFGSLQDVTDIGNTTDNEVDFIGETDGFYKVRIGNDGTGSGDGNGSVQVYDDNNNSAVEIRGTNGIKVHNSDYSVSLFEVIRDDGVDIDKVKYKGTEIENTVNKDATGGYAGLTLFKINFKNVLNTFTSFFTNSNTAARTYTFQDRNGTIADDTDLALKAPLASPSFTGTPISTTAAYGTNTTQIATTAFVLNNSVSLNALGYNVKNYGLVGDGVTDDRAALNTLLNTTAPTGSTIYFPPGTYLIGSNIAISNKQFNFDGAFATIKNNGNYILFNITSTVDLASKWKVTNLYFTGTGTGANQYAFYFSSKSGSFVINNCTFSSLGGGGIAVAGTNINSYLGGLIICCKFYSNTVGIDSLNLGEYLQILGCDFYSNTTAISTVAGNILIDGNNINYNGTGIRVNAGPNDSHGIISNNNINHNSTYGIDINGITLGMTVSNNHIYANNPFRIKDSTGVTISGGHLDVNSYILDTNIGLIFRDVRFPGAYTNTITLTGTAPFYVNCFGLTGLIATDADNFISAGTPPNGTLVSNGGTTLTSTDTIDGLTLIQIVRLLKNKGLLNYNP